MIKNYLTTALRALWRSKASTLINISGLTLGVSTSLLLFLLIRHQASYDTFHHNRDRIYRVVSNTEGNQGRSYSAGVQSVLPEAFRTDFPEAEVVLFTSYRAEGQVTVPMEGGEPKKFEAKQVVYTQPGFFDVFDRKILQGGKPQVLTDPNNAMISRKAAIKYFGKEDVLGKTFSFEGHDYTVRAVLENFPSNTDFPFDMMLSYSTIQAEREKGGWNSIWSDEQCYFLLREDASLAAMEKRLPDFVKKYEKGDTEKKAYELQPLSSIHFDDRYENYNYNTTSKEMLTALGVIAVFLILTACINFINLVTAESFKRSKEVGIRKALGSSRGQLVVQFLGESALVTLVSVILAVGVAQMTLGFLNPFLELSLTLNFFDDAALWIFLLSVTLVVALLSGFYPSMIVSGFKPIFAIKSQTGSKSSSGFILRRGLVVFQFFISQLFIIGTLVLISQMNYFRTKDLGFSKDAIVTIPIPENARLGFTNSSGKMRTLRDKVITMKWVALASLSSAPPSSGNVSSTDFQLEGRDERYVTQLKLVDGHYLDLYKLAIVAGANVTDLDTARGFIVNEKLATMIGFNNPQELIGKNIKVWGLVQPVVGVVKDFHTMSLREPVEATIMFNLIRNYRTLSIKLEGTDWSQTLNEIQRQWEITYPEHIFSYKFLDEEIRKFYEREQKMSTLLAGFTTIAIFIGCLGLFGLATFMANQKTKEIGVRKVLGASAESIVLLFSREYIFLVGIGFVLAAPVAWYFMHQWLDQFAYRIDVGAGVFVAGIGLSLIIAMITVGYRSVRAAMANPADSLRSE